MNVREYLENYNYIGDEIRRLNSELNRLLECREDTYNTLQSQKLSDMPRSQPDDGNDVVSKAAILAIGRFSKSIESLAFQINELLNKQDLFNTIWSKESILSNEERKAIELRYFFSMPWEKIGQTMKYCQRQCKRLAGSAIKALQEEIDITLINL